MNAICSHLDTIELTELPQATAGCEDCLARSAEPGEDWSRCYVDEVAFVVE
jgi:hypothetical protein